MPLAADRRFREIAPKAAMQKAFLPMISRDCADFA
jgi:hypothetical protein